MADALSQLFWRALHPKIRKMRAARREAAVQEGDAKCWIADVARARCEVVVEVRHHLVLRWQYRRLEYSRAAVHLDRDDLKLDKEKQ